jgi:beta-galactosidase
VIQNFDQGWLFNYGDATGANATTFADTAWRHLNVPHDWSIEGPNPPANPFSQSAATTGRGGYLPSGISWYRKHFTLPQSQSGNRVFVEFDGVMANSDVYLNGTRIGHHPYGYVSFRYDITSNVQFGTVDNVIAVKTDTSTQPASRFYAGAGIYRHVRLIGTNPVHVGQYATYVTTPAPTTTAATVHVTTTVVNSGTTAANVTVQGTVSDPAGTSLSPVTTAAQNIAAGASANFTFDVPVSNPKLWDLTAPNMYSLATNVQVGGTTVDNDITPFGIREIKFNAGMTLNGKPVKFQGVCLHQDYHGLGLAAPQRAMQRRLAKLKLYGVNAIRTSHEPPSPEFLDLTDRMGFLVLDEFTDVWTAHKYADVGDYSAYFNQTATTPTGMPTVPTVTGVTPTGAPWWQVDFTGWIMRDRNHPSVALYSMGNEIHDSLATRTPILTKMVAISHNLDPSRGDTQALLDPATSGDVGGATNTLLDVWGDNYDVNSVLTAMVNSPTKSGFLTEKGTATSTWATIAANTAFTGMFMWTGVDYLGESDGAWPTVGSSAGILDELGTPKTLAFSWQSTWGYPKTTFTTGATAGKVVLTADHSSITTDLNDVVFVMAAVPTVTAPVTFSITGPGTIIAVDSGSQTQETFRGNTRNASGNLAFAIVQATGTGTITVTATSAGLTAGTTTIQATAGAFVPCSGTCD